MLVIFLNLANHIFSKQLTAFDVYPSASFTCVSAVLMLDLFAEIVLYPKQISRQKGIKKRKVSVQSRGRILGKSLRKFVAKCPKIPKLGKKEDI
jgi:hypothetical protein